MKLLRVDIVDIAEQQLYQEIREVSNPRLLISLSTYHRAQIFQILKKVSVKSYHILCELNDLKVLWCRVVIHRLCCQNSRGDGVQIPPAPLSVMTLLGRRDRLCLRKLRVPRAVG